MNAQRFEISRSVAEGLRYSLCQDSNLALVQYPSTFISTREGATSHNARRASQCMASSGVNERHAKTKLSKAGLAKKDTLLSSHKRGMSDARAEVSRLMLCPSKLPATEDDCNCCKAAFDAAMCDAGRLTDAAPKSAFACAGCSLSRL